MTLLWRSGCGPPATPLLTRRRRPRPNQNLKKKSTTARPPAARRAAPPRARARGATEVIAAPFHLQSQCARCVPQRGPFSARRSEGHDIAVAIGVWSAGDPVADAAPAAAPEPESKKEIDDRAATGGPPRGAASRARKRRH